MEKGATSLARPEEKILPLDRMRQQVKEWQAVGLTVVFTNGCFDLLHVGHVTLIDDARREGDRLILAINSDASVASLKPGRPLIPENERAEILAALHCVDAVVIYDELTPREIVSALLPDVLVKGGDWADNKIIGREEVEAAGGRVVSIPVVPGYSTTEILRKIREGAPSAEAAAESATPAPPSPTKS